MVKKVKNITYYEAVGRRKEATARVRLYLTGKDKTATVNGQKVKAGTILLNGKKIENYFCSLQDKVRYLFPFKLANAEDRFVTSIFVSGGGKQGQLDAVILGVVRAIEKSDKEKIHPIFKKEGLFTRDSRTRQRRKVGTGGKSRRKKQSPKR